MFVQLVIGVDLGRTYSRVGIFRNGTVELVVDEQGRDLLPSYVAFIDQGPPLVGFAAKDQADQRTPKIPFMIRSRSFHLRTYEDNP